MIGQTIFHYRIVQKLGGGGVWLRRVLIPGVLMTLLLGIAAAEPVAAPADAAETIVAIGDIHGDFDDFIAILGRTGLIDTQHRWTGGRATLVQIGDLLDRGPKAREVMDLLISLQMQAAKAGGRVVTLLGNHEMMNLMGDLRYVTATNYASFADKNSEQRRRSAYQEFIKWRKSHAGLLTEIPGGVREQSETEWIAQHPPGFIEQRDAFGPNASYGKWLRERPAVAKIGSIIFLHGGIHPALTSLSLDQINVRVHGEISAFDRTKQYLLEQKLILPFFTLEEITAIARAQLNSLHKLTPEQLVAANRQQELKLLEDFLAFGSWLSVDSDGPLWFRGYDKWNEQDGAAQIEKVLRTYEAGHIVAGHTPQQNGRIRSRFGGRVFLIDTGMLASYYPGGRASALSILNQARFTAEYMDHQEVLLEGTAVSRRGLDDRPAFVGRVNTSESTARFTSHQETFGK